MTKKYIKDMTNEELEKVFNANEQLRSDIEDDMVEAEMSHISEQLGALRDSARDWSIGPYNRNYIEVKDAWGFIDGVVELENSIPVLIDSDSPLLEETVKAKEKLFEINTIEDHEEAEVLEQFMLKVDSLAQDLADRIAYRFTQSLDGCGKREYQLDYFITFYSVVRLDPDSCYIEGNSYELKEDVTRSFN